MIFEISRIHLFSYNNNKKENTISYSNSTNNTTLIARVIRKEKYDFVRKKTKGKLLLLEPVWHTYYALGFAPGVRKSAGIQ